MQKSLVRREGTSSECAPSYFVYGGLVFLPVSRPLCRAMYQGAHKQSKDVPFAIEALIDELQEEGEQKVSCLLLCSVRGLCLCPSVMHASHFVYLPSRPGRQSPLASR